MASIDRMSAPLFEFALASLLIELTPGPNMAYLAALSLAEGRRTGLAAVAGVALGLAGIGLLAAFGLAAAVERIPYAYEVLRYAGAGFLLYLAWEGWRGIGDAQGDSIGRGAAFRRALLTNLLNPKAAAFYLAVLPLFLNPARQDITVQTLELVAVYVAIATAVHAALVLFAAGLRPYLVQGPYERLVRRLLAASLALVAIWFFWGTRR
jgi:threonine/homoserine/homoserine lactone efflux protein